MKAGNWFAFPEHLYLGFFLFGSLTSLYQRVRCWQSGHRDHYPPKIKYKDTSASSVLDGLITPSPEVVRVDTAYVITYF